SCIGIWKIQFAAQRSICAEAEIAGELKSRRPMYSPIVLAASVLIIASVLDKPTDTVWVSQKQDPTLWSRVSYVLSAELAADDPASIGPHCRDTISSPLTALI